MRYWYAIFLVFCSWKNSASAADSDTIPEVQVIAYRERAYLPGFNSFSPDSLSQLVFGRSDLGDLLHRTAPVLINNYGSGNASVSIRGTNDDHTLVLWNGIPLNSLTLGSMDISLLSTEASPHLQVVTNAGSNVFGSGAFGGVILLDEDARWQPVLRVSLRNELGSFDTYRSALNITAGQANWQFRSASFYQQAENDFPYTDIFKTGSPKLNQTHNDLRQYGTVNTLRWKMGNKHFFQAGNWYQRKEKSIPNIMGSFQPSSKYQEDGSVRSYLKYNRLFRSAQLQVSTAHIYDELVYTDKLNPTDTFLFINSGFETHRWLNSATYRQYFKALQFDAAGDLNLVQANVSAYGGVVREVQGAVFAGVQYPFKRFAFSATIRQEFRPGKYIRPMFGVQANYQTKNNRYRIGLSYADKYHAPDLNDRYWSPGGKPGLLPEQGFTAEMSHQLTLHQQNRSELLLRCNVYYTRIRDEIVWMPVSGLVWSPENMRSARHYGLESQLDYKRQLRNGLIDIQALYLFNRAEIRSVSSDRSLEGNLLAYKPQHMLKTGASYRNDLFSAGVNYVFTGKRYTDNENIEAFSLPGYGLLDLYAGISVPVQPFSLDMLLRISNALDKDYQSVRAYAQPGRSINLSVILNFNKSLSHEN